MRHFVINSQTNLQTDEGTFSTKNLVKCDKSQNIILLLNFVHNSNDCKLQHNNNYVKQNKKKKKRLQLIHKSQLNVMNKYCKSKNLAAT